MKYESGQITQLRAQGLRRVLLGHVFGDCAVAEGAATGTSGDDFEIASLVTNRREGDGGAAEDGVREPL